MEQTGQLPLVLALALRVLPGGLEDGHQHGVAHRPQPGGVQLPLDGGPVGLMQTSGQQVHLMRSDIHKKPPLKK